MNTPRRVALASAMTVVLAFAGACAGAPPRPDFAPDPWGAAARALLLARLGDQAEALAELSEALGGTAAGTLDARFAPTLLAAEAWTLLVSGDAEAARASLARAREAGASGPGILALEFRLGGPADRSRAVDFAERARAAGAASRLDALALELMAGAADLRDAAIGSIDDASTLATYLAGYRVEPPAPKAGSGTRSEAGAKPGPDPALVPNPATGPIVVVAEPESVGADEAVLAVARLAYRDGLQKTGAFRVVDAASRRAAVEELELSLSGAAAAERDKAVGGLFSADYVASGSVVRTDAGWLVAWTLSDADDGRIVASEFAAAPDHAAVMASAAGFANALGGLERAGSLHGASD